MVLIIGTSMDAGKTVRQGDHPGTGAARPAGRGDEADRRRPLQDILASRTRARTTWPTSSSRAALDRRPTADYEQAAAPALAQVAATGAGRGRRRGRRLAARALQRRDRAATAGAAPADARRLRFDPTRWPASSMLSSAGPTSSPAAPPAPTPGSAGRAPDRAGGPERARPGSEEVLVRMLEERLGLESESSQPRRDVGVGGG